MKLTFTNGTAEQKAWVNAAIAVGEFDWGRLSSTVAISFENPDSDTTDNFHVFAHTNIPLTPQDSCGRPDSATILIHPNLLAELASYGPAGARHADAIYGAYDVIYHELFHVLASKFTTDQVTAMTQILGASTWETSDSDAWYDSGSEAYAETGKDVYLGDNRQWDNRTRHRLTEERLDSFFAVLDNVCPCGGGGDGGIE